MTVVFPGHTHLFLIQVFVLPHTFIEISSVPSAGQQSIEALEEGGGGGGGVPVSHIPLIILKNIPYLKNNMANIPKINPSIRHPFKYLQKYPVSI